MSQAQVQNSNSTATKERIKMSKATVGTFKQSRKKLGGVIKSAQKNRAKKTEK